MSVVMPTYRQAPFIARAINSLLAQDFTDWELLIVDDGSPDDTATVVERYTADQRVRYLRLEDNIGLGAAANSALELAGGEFIAYLPSDDVYFDGHLRSLVDCLDARGDAVLAFSGVRSHIRVNGKGVVDDRTSLGQITGTPLQLVQVMHRTCSRRWLERRDFVTDDLERMYWSSLRPLGTFVGTGAVTCEWVDHPTQRHKIIQEPLGGPNPYRQYYGVREPLRFSSSTGYPHDEVAHYHRYRERPDTPVRSDGLTILIVGELAFNPERVLALEERGHRLFGLWTDQGHWFNTVGPVPFGHVTDVPRSEWRQAVRELRPDVMYALLNWEAVPFAHEVLSAGLDVPFVWHLKESPFDCITAGTWPLLVDLHTRSDAQIYSSAELRDWFDAALPHGSPRRTLVLDGDLPKADWFLDDQSELLSARNGEVHTVVPGAPIGITPALLGRLAAADIHLHFYGDFHQGQWRSWISAAKEAAPQHLHLHPHVAQADWVTELSRYDAGWLHQERSSNGGDLRRATWYDLNIPARVATLGVSGVPMILPDNSASVVAMQSLVRRLDIGVFYSDIDDLIAQLHDRAAMRRLRKNTWEQRENFMFDSHADGLVQMFRTVSATRAARP